MNPTRQTIDNPTGDAHIDRLRGVPTDGDISGLQSRNQERAEAARRAMGTRYCCHPAHAPRRKQEPATTPEPPRFLMRVA